MAANQENESKVHDALSGSEFAPGWLESENFEKDKALKKKILEELEAHLELDASEIKVDVKDGFVSVTGNAKDVNDKETIESLVESIDGVKDVASAIQWHY